MNYLLYGDSAMLINFEQKIDELINQKVMALHQALSVSGIEGVTFLIPAYCSLTVGFDNAVTSFEELKSTIDSFANEEMNHLSSTSSRLVHIPVCYESPFKLDMLEVMEHTQLSRQSIISLHTSITFRVYMLGFVAGFAYMGTLPEVLKCPRKEVPRLKVPEGSVGLAGLQTGIYPTEAPGGWQIIGKTPLKMFDHDQPSPSLLQPGDQVQFKAINKQEFHEIEKLQSVGEFELEVTDA
jgi:KipI family sensor histidine kinase inhibitor